MKVTFKTPCGLEVTVEPQSESECARVGDVIASIERHSFRGRASTAIAEPRLKTNPNTVRASELVEFLQWADGPVKATWFVEKVKDSELFRTETGNPIHLIRRALTADPRIDKTVAGLFKIKDVNSNAPLD